MIEKAAKFLKQSNVLVIGAGAGMGKDSGLPDFRGNEGFWNNYPPYRNKFNFYQCANPNFLIDHPDLFWGFYGSRLQLYRSKIPHQGFGIATELASKMSQGEQNYFVVTSNVDGHFTKAGYPIDKVYQIHGSINHLQCNSCYQITVNQFKPDIDYEQMKCKNVPKCQKCGEIQRPNILMFGDYDWNSSRSDGQERYYRSFQKKHNQDKFAILQIGCGTAVPTIRSMMQQLYFIHKDSKLIRINPDSTISSSKWLDSERYAQVNLGALQALTQLKKVYQRL